MELLVKQGMKKIFQILLLFMLGCSVLYAKNAPVLIIKSSDNSFFNRTIDEIKKQASSEIEFNIINLKSIQSNDHLLRESLAIITLGMSAANYLVGKELNKPVIHSYLTEFQYKNRKKHKDHVSVLLDQPFQRYLKFIKYLLPVKNISIIKQSDNKIDAKGLKRLSKSLNIKLQQRIYNANDNPLNLVKEILKSSDVLLSLPNPNIYNRQSLKGILLTSYRQKKPLISYSPAHVKSGALASIYSSPENIGNQLSKLINSILEDKFFRPEPFYYASGFDIKINHRVAKSLGLKLSDKDQVISQINKSEKR